MYQDSDGVKQELCAGPGWLLLGCSLWLGGCQTAGSAGLGGQAARWVVIVRHAEKVDEARDAGLSVQGQARAEQLAYVLRHVPISDIVVSQFDRTQATAGPLAQSRGLVPLRIDADRMNTWVMNWVRAKRGEALLVVGHSDTVPELLARLGVSGPQQIVRTDYGNLFFVAPDAKRPSLLWMQY